MKPIDRCSGSSGNSTLKEVYLALHYCQFCTAVTWNSKVTTALFFLHANRDCSAATMATTWAKPDFLNITMTINVLWGSDVHLHTYRSLVKQTPWLDGPRTVKCKQHELLGQRVTKRRWQNGPGFSVYIWRVKAKSKFRATHTLRCLEPKHDCYWGWALYH